MISALIEEVELPDAPRGEFVRVAQRARLTVVFAQVALLEQVGCACFDLLAHVFFGAGGRSRGDAEGDGNQETEQCGAHKRAAAGREDSCGIVPADGHCDFVKTQTPRRAYLTI